MSESQLLPVLLGEFARYRDLGERVVAQLDDADLFYKPDDESNSIAVIIKHMAGNMRSRWTDFLTTDGEKPDRQRDGEFEDDDPTREEVLARWNQGWQYVFDALEPLEEADLDRTVFIRGEPHTAFQAIVRQLGHYAQHVGQMAYVGKHLKGARWESLSIPKGQSEEYPRRKP